MKKAISVFVLVLALCVLFAFPGCGGTAGEKAKPVSSAEKEVLNDPRYKPDFSEPVEELKETSDRAFAKQLYQEALAYEPLLGQAGTQVNMGYYSARGNHGSLVRLIDAINEQPQSDGAPPQKAIWDEGATSSYQYPSFDEMLREHWYERANPVDGKVAIFGVKYTDPHPVTMQQADDIWGEYSQRYTDMAALIRQATGKPVKAWCFVQGAKANRVFYKYELPELRALEQSGSVQVYFARTQDACESNPSDWIEGTANAPVPAQ